jgi:capsular exopolysaccharide synthesis family protein
MQHPIRKASPAALPVAYPADPFAGDGELPRRSPLLILWDRRWTVLGCVGAALAAAIVYLLLATPVYEGVAKLAVEQGGQPRLINDIAGVAQTQNYLQTQAELIRSSEILGRVARLPEIASMETLRGSADIVANLQSRVGASVSVRSDVIVVSARSVHREDASAIANAVASVYQGYVNERRRRTASDLVRWLTDKKDATEKELQAKLDEKIRQVQQTGISIAYDRGNPVLTRAQELTNELNRLEVQLKSAEASLRSAKSAAEDPGRARFLLDSIAARGGAMTNQIRGEIRQRQRDLLAMSGNYLPGFPELERIRQLLKSLQDELAAEDKRLLEAYIAQLDLEYQTLRFRHDEIAKLTAGAMADFKRYNEDSVRLQTVESDIRRLEGQIASLDTQVRNVDLTEDADFAANITVMERAPERGPGVPVSPKYATTLASALIGGLLLGAALAFLRDLLDQRLRSPDEVKQVLNLPVLGAVPHILRARTPGERGQIVHLEPMSDLAESYRTVRTAVYFGVPAGSVRTLLITSPQPGDGKTTLASNLAIAMAQAGNRVLLLDADFRRPMQHKVFDLDKSVGVSSVLAGEKPLAEAIRATAIDGLSVLPCGPIPANPSEILNGSAFAETLETLKRDYDLVLIDSPPVLPVTDARILAASCDVTLLALRAEKSTRKTAQYARDVLVSVGAQLLGVVVNDVPRTRGGYGSYRGSYLYAYGYGNATRRVAGGSASPSAVRGELVPDPAPPANGNGH